jgi:hypothetical protein
VDEQEKQRLVHSIKSSGDTQALQIRGWIGHTLHLSNWLISNPSHDHIATFENIFWVRLYGIIVEIGEPYKATFEAFDSYTVDDFIKKYQPNVETAEIFKGMYDISSLISQIKNSFSREELIFIEYMRHTNCHVLQKNYGLTIKGSGEKQKLKEQKQISTTGEILHIEIIQQILDDITKDCVGKHILVAIDFNKRINKILDKLFTLYDSMCF